MGVSFKTPSSAEQALGDQFRSFAASRGRDGAVRRREAAFARFAAAGLPNRHHESWHYTDLRAILREALAPAPCPDVALVAEARERLKAHRLPGSVRVVILDGSYNSDLSDLAGVGPHVHVTSVAEALSEDALADGLAAAQSLGDQEAVLALNAAFHQGGVMIEVEPGVKVEPVIEIVSLLSGRQPAATYHRSYVRVGDHAAATVLERHAALNEAPSTAHAVLVVAVGDGASFDHLARVDGLGSQAVHVGMTLVRLGADARFEGTTLIATPGMTRRQAYLEFAGPHSTAHFNGVSLLDGRCHADTTLIVTHTAPHCESRELYKHILDEESTGIYQGKVIVAPGAQKTDGKMLSKAIFLGEAATMYNKPELEIFADDVVCGHGATVGSLDEDQLFYLRARGIPLGEAQALLLEAFASEAIESVQVDALKHEMSERIGQWLRQHGR